MARETLSGWRRRSPRIAVESGIRAVGPQALERIGDERKQLEVDLDPLDRLRGSRLVHGGDGEDRLALVARLVGERSFGAAWQLGQVVSREDRLHTRHRQRLACVDASHARVWHRAEQELREQHALGAKVFGVFRAPGHLGDLIGGRVVLADVLARHSRTLDLASPTVNDPRLRSSSEAEVCPQPIA